MYPFQEQFDIVIVYMEYKKKFPKNIHTFKYIYDKWRQTSTFAYSNSEQLVVRRATNEENECHILQSVI